MAGKHFLFIIFIHTNASYESNYHVISSSPLGFSELFNEFRLQENLHSLDDILNAIINSEGMSFNDLKPIYKEFLLKLAVTLTKDELYQRSKSIMRRQKKKLLRRKKKSAAYQVNIKVHHICMHIYCFMVVSFSVEQIFNIKCVNIH